MDRGACRAPPSVETIIRQPCPGHSCPAPAFQATLTMTSDAQRVEHSGLSWLPHSFQSPCPSCIPQASPITQKGFRANLSRPLQPRYRQQQPAAQIRTKYSTPNTTMVTISCRGGRS